MIEGNIHHTREHSSSSTMSGGAIDSKIYKYALGSYESEIIADFGSDHIIQATFLLSNKITDGLPSGYEWVIKKSFIPNMPMIFGHYLQFKGNVNEVYNGGNRIRQVSLFQRIPELIVARDSLNHNRIPWWCDDIASGLYCAAIGDKGNAEFKRFDEIIGIRRAFLIGKGD